MTISLDKSLRSHHPVNTADSFLQSWTSKSTRLVYQLIVVADVSEFMSADNKKLENRNVKLDLFPRERRPVVFSLWTVPFSLYLDHNKKSKGFVSRLLVYVKKITRNYISWSIINSYQYHLRNPVCVGAKFLSHLQREESFLTSGKRSGDLWPSGFDLLLLCVSSAGAVLQGAQTRIHMEAPAGLGYELSGRRGDGSEDQSPPQTATPPQTQAAAGRPEETEDLHGQNRYWGHTWHWCFTRWHSEICLYQQVFTPFSSQLEVGHLLSYCWI